ncbi:MAG: hypothetical protein ACPGLV_12755 [Bacteroidia bacterium]
MKNFIKCTLTAFLFITAFSANAQVFSTSGQVGYSSAKGDAFKDDNGVKQSSFGLGYEADALLYLESFDNKLGVGIMYSGNALFGKNESTATGIAIYGLNLYGLKGQYRLLSTDKSFSPYGSLGLGLSQFSVPTITINGSEIGGGKGYSLGMRPEIGLDINGLLISAQYFVPMKYSVESDAGTFEGSAGTFTISVGYRKYFDL